MPAWDSDIVSSPSRGLGRVNGTILVIDDDNLSRELIANHLRVAGADVQVCEDGPAALRLLAKRPTLKLIVLDMQMPMMDGYETAQEIRRLGVKTPILALTAHNLPADRDRCLRAGCDDYCSKPVTAERLQTICQSLLQRARAA